MYKRQVLRWSATGFSQPVDTGASVLNTVKGGSTVPVKFELFAGSRELTDTGLVSFSARRVTCPGGATVDEIETLVSGSTSLRYDTSSGHFQYNWKTPTGAGTCYTLTMSAADGVTSLAAGFKLR